MEIDGVSSPHMAWDTRCLPKAWSKFKLQMDLMVSVSFKRKRDDENAASYSFESEKNGRSSLTRGHSERIKSKALNMYFTALRCI